MKLKIALLSSLLFCGVSNASTIVWSATDNLYATNSNDTVPGSGVGQRILVGSGYDSYVTFDTDGTYADVSQIESAILRLYLPYNSSNTSSDIEVTVNMVLNSYDDWTTWTTDDTYPEAGDVISVSYTLSPSAATIVTGTDTSGAWFEWDVTGLVKILNSGLDNNIATFLLTASDGSVFRFEGVGNTLGSGNTPQLVVTAIPEASSVILGAMAFLIPLLAKKKNRRNA